MKKEIVFGMIKKPLSALLCASLMMTGAGCTQKTTQQVEKTEEADTEKQTDAAEQADTVTALTPLNVIDDAYRTTYEIFVYSFYDSDGDGIGDLQGVIDKLDYINDGDDATDTDLGCNEIWLMPVCPSPTYHKYDVTDYCDIDPQYGTMDDYKKLIEEAHKRGIKVINDMVMNHTSSEHPWFKEATKYLKNLPEGGEINAGDCKYALYYNFTEQGGEGYEKVPGTNWYYEARFWSGMPDLNLSNEEVRKEFADIAKFWLDAGCDGFRMDAVTQYYSDDIDQNTIALGNFVDDVKAIKEDAYIVGEAWTTSREYSRYYASGIDSLFDFDFADKEGTIAKCARGKMSPVKYLEQQIKEDELYSSYNENYVNAPFYTNHDMARSAGYYTGKNALSSVKLAGALNLLMNGNAFIYYGEEIGMKGSGKDENKRAPMQWDSDAQAEGMCKGPSGMEKIDMIYGSLSDQENDPSSIYNYYKKAIRLRNTYPSIARGDITILNDLCADRCAVWIKSWDENTDYDIMIALNNSDEETTIDFTKDQGAEGYRVLSDMLVTGDDEVVLNEDKLTLPGGSIAILKKAD